MAARHHCAASKAAHRVMSDAGAAFDEVFDELESALQHGGAHETLAENLPRLREARLRIATCPIKEEEK